MTQGDDECFDACEIVRTIKSEGSKTRCDDTNDAFNNNFQLPTYYDVKKFKRGQKFFHDHIFAMFFAKLLGLMTGFASPVSYKILKYTKKSSEPLSAYKRYVSTIFHMYTWYNTDLTPNSKLWQSLKTVRYRHNSASRTCGLAGVGVITQVQMSLTQFAFMGYALARPKHIGIFDVNEEDLEGFVHFWRVLGYMMGIEERFNICKDNASKTKQVCEEIMEQIVKPAVGRLDMDYLDLVNALMEGLWVMTPVLETNVWMRLLFEVIYKKRMHIFKLNPIQWIIYTTIVTTKCLLRFRVLRLIQNYYMRCILFLTRNYPILAYYKFGKSNSYVPL